MSVSIVVLVAVAVFAALRIAHRARRRPNDRAAPGRPRTLRLPFDPGRSETGLVATREVRERVRGKVFRGGTVLVLAGVAAGIVVPVLDRSTDIQPFGVVGVLTAPAREAILSTTRSLGTTARFIHEASPEAARSDLRSGRVEVAIIAGRELVVNKAIASTDSSKRAQLVRAVSKTLGTEKALAEARLSPTQAGVLARAAPLPVASLQPGASRRTARTSSTISIVLVFLMLTQYNAWTMMGVMEEKSSRVVEVLLAAVRPAQLLGGKVLGIGLVVFAQAALIVVFAVGLAKAVGSDLLHGTAPLVLAATLLWLLLGYAFYCWVYAAAGSLAERQDQIQSLVLPVSLPIIFGYVMALTTLGTGSPSILFRVLAYVPLTAPLAMPVLVALGTVSWWGFAASAALSVLCTFGVARLATGIYRKAVLHTGPRVRLRDVIGANR